MILYHLETKYYEISRKVYYVYRTEDENSLRMRFEKPF